MTFRIETFGTQTCIIDEETEFTAGRIRYSVFDEHAEEIAVVNSPKKAISALAAHVASRPSPKWERQSPTSYEKLTWYGILLVERSTDGYWLAYRNCCLLTEDGSPAKFHSYSEAQAAADAHLHDGFPSEKETGDQLFWADREDGAI
jgi:hypothetical protein